jgi:hypothetical protein
LVAEGAATVNSVGPLRRIGFHIPALRSMLAGVKAGAFSVLSVRSFEQEDSNTTMPVRIEKMNRNIFFILFPFKKF